MKLMTLLYGNRRQRLPGLVPGAFSAFLLLTASTIALAQSQQGTPPNQQNTQNQQNGQNQQNAQNQQSSNAHGSESADLEKLSADDSNWPMATKNYANTRYSSLDQINTSNAKDLKLAWSFSVGADRGQEAAPLIVNGIMYVVAPYAMPQPNRVFALDATTGDLIWSYTPKPNPSAIGEACCDVISRGLGYDNGKVFLNTLDGYAVAIDAKSGKELWHTKLADINKGETITMAPFVVKGKILVGNSGGEMGVRGWLTAVDEDTGRIVWRAYGTGPDKDVLIGPEFKPFYARNQGQDLGVKSWPPDRWKIGGGTFWGWIQYDPELNTIYYGTGNPGPWNPNERPGDNLWSCTMFARDADTGAAKWATQLDPHDLWDYDEINESILMDLPVNGATRKVIVHPSRNGFMYIMDRTTGEILSADPYGYQNVYEGFDMKSGRPIPVKSKQPATGQTVTNICPVHAGVKDWQPTAYSPRTKLMYIPHQHMCMNWKSTQVGYIAGTPYVGAVVDTFPGPGGYRGEFAAWDLQKYKKVWAIKESFPVWSGTLVTGGDVAFYGTMDRSFKAVNAKTGDILWQIKAPSGIIGQPVTYKGRDGNQYVAILAGVGGWPGVVANAELDPRVRNGALGFVGGMQDLPLHTAGGSSLLVFSLPKAQQASLPENNVHASAW